MLSQTIKKEINGTSFSFKDASPVTIRLPSHRLQALSGKQFCGSKPSPTAESHYRVTMHCPTFETVLLKLKSRFENKDEEILCVLAEVVTKKNASSKSRALVSSFSECIIPRICLSRSVYDSKIITLQEEYPSFNCNR